MNILIWSFSSVSQTSQVIYFAGKSWKFVFYCFFRTSVFDPVRRIVKPSWRSVLLRAYRTCMQGRAPSPCMTIWISAIGSYVHVEALIFRSRHNQCYDAFVPLVVMIMGTRFYELLYKNPFAIYCAYVVRTISLRIKQICIVMPLFNSIGRFQTLISQNLINRIPDLHNYLRYGTFPNTKLKGQRLKCLTCC
jgi:hypothetical protein